MKNETNKLKAFGVLYTFIPLYILVEIIICASCLPHKNITNRLSVDKTHEHLLSHIPISEGENPIKLEDFFWTGSGDGPPDYVRNVHTENNGKEVIVKTETVIATVYVQGQNDVDTVCLDCTNDNEANFPINITVNDRRYWLLTVVAGFFPVRDLLLLEDNLGSLYRVAFTRQYTRHLGINGNSNFSSAESLTDDDMYFRTKRMVNGSLDSFQHDATASETQNSKQIYDDIGPEANSRPKISNYESSESSSPPGLPGSQKIRVVIHNITLLTEEELQKGDSIHLETADRMNRPLANQTEIIYSVFVAEKPILASTAADDMKLVSQNEVMQVMGRVVFMKAEPYLKEPQATPLIPSKENGNGDVLGAISTNPLVIVISTIVVLALIILLIALLLMTRAKRQRSAEVKRLSARQNLLTEQTISGRFESSERVSDQKSVPIRNFNQGLSRGTDGVDNLAYVDDSINHRTKHVRTTSPTIEFPLPPPTSRPSSSGTSTSDSSVYCPLNKPNVDLQDMLDRKAATLFEKKRRSKHQASYISPPSEPMYATVSRNRDRKSRQKLKRKENKVGSIDGNKTSSSQISTDSFTEQNAGVYEYSETYNRNVNVAHYHKNKILQERVFADHIVYATSDRIQSPTEAINREILKISQPHSPGMGSIGSYLSMASIRSFPQQSLPEPLHRVLEPISVTYYDEPEGNEQLQTPSKVLRKSKGIKTVTLDENPKYVEEHRGSIAAGIVQSDHSDPGVIGPIVWETHKKNMESLKKIANSIPSPTRDPATTQSRYEGLLEGAIKLYTQEIPDQSNVANQEYRNLPGGNIRHREFRAKTANVVGYSNKFKRSNSDIRPVTAGPITARSNSSTQPPSPNGKAWSSGAPSPLVRPLSAGPFHRPEPPIVDVTRILAATDRSQMSAAPLIEAIQNELKKFKKENKSQ